MNKRKLAILLVAENHAGKTKVAEGLLHLNQKMAHYSMRTIIEMVFKDKTKEQFPKERGNIQKFSEYLKIDSGSEIFLKEAMRQFQESTYELAIIESIRAPGETLWVKSEEFQKEFPDISPWVIGLIAPVEQRYSRFLSERSDNIATALTRQVFDEHEQMSNHGIEPWEENISTTMEYVDFKVANLDGALQDTVTQIHEVTLDLQKVTV